MAGDQSVETSLNVIYVASDKAKTRSKINIAEIGRKKRER